MFPACTVTAGMRSSSALQDVVMKAGREEGVQAAPLRTAFGADIPEADEEYQDDEYLVGVGSHSNLVLFSA